MRIYFKFEILIKNSIFSCRETCRYKLALVKHCFF